MKETTNFGLKKPEETDFYDVNTQNDNMDDIDRVLQEFKDGTQTVGDAKNLGGRPAEDYITGDHKHRVSDIEGFPLTMPPSNHMHSASDVGLGNVPNVSTNDQTPTYSVASANAELTSGEKLSVAFGKIARAIKSLISHIKDTKLHIPTPQTANNATFLRNDNTWQKVTPANIGALSTTDTAADSDKLGGVEPSGYVKCSVPMTLSVNSDGGLRITY